MSPEAPRRRRVAVRGRRARREWRPKGRRTCQAGQAARAGRRMTSCRYCPEGNTASTLPHMRSHACRPLPVADVWWSAQASALCPSWLELGSAMMSTILEPDAPPAAVEAELLIMARHFYHRGACIDGQDILREMALGRMGTWAQEVRTAPPHSLTPVLLPAQLISLPRLYAVASMHRVGSSPCVLQQGSKASQLAHFLMAQITASVQVALTIHPALIVGVLDY